MAQRETLGLRILLRTGSHEENEDSVECNLAPKFERLLEKQLILDSLHARAHLQRNRSKN